MLLMIIIVIAIFITIIIYVFKGIYINKFHFESPLFKLSFETKTEKDTPSGKK